MQDIPKNFIKIEPSNIEHDMIGVLRVLQYLRSNLSCNAYLIGGSPSDWFLGREPRDFDVLITDYNCSSYFNLAQDRSVVPMLEDNRYGGYLTRAEFNSYCHMTEQGKSLAGFQTDKVIDILTWEDNILQRFCLFPTTASICLMSDDGKFYASPAFLYTHTNKEVVYNTKFESDKYLDKIRNKYKDYRFIGVDSLDFVRIVCSDSIESVKKNIELSNQVLALDWF